MAIERNEAGDRFDGLKDPTPAPAPALPPRGLPPGASHFNESGDPVYPPKAGDRNESGDPIPQPVTNRLAPVRALCGSCRGRGKWMELDGAGVFQPVVCQECGGLKYAR